MAMKKYGDNAEVQVFIGKQAAVASQHIQKHGKPVSEFTEEEKQAFLAELAEGGEE